MNMLYKKSLLKAAIATLLLTFVSSSSFSSPYGSILDNEYYDDYSGDYSYYGTDLEEEKSGNFYMSFNYSKVNPGVSSFSAKEDTPGIKTEKILSLDGNGKLQEGYNPEYNVGFAGNASIGYKIGNFRVELEGLASSANAGNTHIELENSRRSMISFDGPGEEKSYYIKILTNDAKEVFYGNKYDFSEFKYTDPQYKELFVDNTAITNEGFQNKAAMINAYYNINNSSDFTPYFGIGGGLTNIKFFGVSKIKPAIQGKFGLHYNISDKIQLSGGYRYFTSLGNSSFNGVKLEREIPGLRFEIQEKRYDFETNKYLFDTLKVADLPGSTTATVESNFANHALEVGLTFNF